MALAKPGWIDVPRDGLAHAVVVRLDVVAGDGRAHEAPRAQQRQRGRSSVAGAACAQSGRRLDRPSRQRNRFEEPPGFGLQLGHAAQQPLLQRAGFNRAVLPHQLGDEQGIASSFARDPRRASGVRNLEERERELAGLIGW